MTRLSPPFNMKKFSCGCDYKKIHTGLVSFSNDDGATIIEVYPTQQSRFDAEQQKLDKQLDKSLDICRC
jgi:hypothetical protein